MRHQSLWLGAAVVAIVGVGLAIYLWTTRAPSIDELRGLTTAEVRAVLGEPNGTAEITDWPMASREPGMSDVDHAAAQRDLDRVSRAYVWLYDGYEVIFSRTGHALEIR